MTSTTVHQRRQILAAAEAHMISLSPSSDPDMTTWAAGVLIVRHALELSIYLSTGDASQSFGSEYSGLYGREYDYRCDRKAVTITEHTTGYRTTVRLREIATLIEPVLSRYDVRTEIEQAMRERRHLVDLRQSATHRRQRAHTAADGQPTAEEHEAELAWGGMERRCEQIAAAAWAACRPNQQQTLFDL